MTYTESREPWWPLRVEFMIDPESVLALEEKSFKIPKVVRIDEVTHIEVIYKKAQSVKTNRNFDPE